MASPSPDGAFGQVLELIQTGGPVVVILLGFSVVALTVILLKLYQFRTVRIGERRFIGAALAQYRAGRSGEALATLNGSRNPIARALEVAIRGVRQERVGSDVVREEVWRVGSDSLEALRSHLRILEVVATLSPLLGLFGTVLGMIDAFQQLEGAGSQVNPAILSGGIWVALLTTAAGLAVAIPVVAVLNGLERTVDRLGHDMESAVTQVFTRELAEPEDSHEPTPLRRAQVQPAE
ncbi:MotA/TolQ/ExbB proton channel family protein [Virgifigura deserti]|uniref:MotA/TolQ/ExbB proton channel family protein n=1 Tax=Virgifigura deserti TaxID=2268457 RepID=UPI003CCBB80A